MHVGHGNISHDGDIQWKACPAQPLASSAVEWHRLHHQYDPSVSSSSTSTCMTGSMQATIQWAGVVHEQHSRLAHDSRLAHYTGTCMNNTASLHTVAANAPIYLHEQHSGHARNRSHAHYSNIIAHFSNTSPWQAPAHAWYRASRTEEHTTAATAHAMHVSTPCRPVAQQSCRASMTYCCRYKHACSATTSMCASCACKMSDQACQHTMQAVWLGGAS